MSWDVVHVRVVETDEGIQGEFTVEIYGQMQRPFLDKGWMATKAVIRSGIAGGLALDVGAGAGMSGSGVDETGMGTGSV